MGEMSATIIVTAVDIYGRTGNLLVICSCSVRIYRGLEFLFTQHVYSASNCLIDSGLLAPVNVTL